MTAPCAFRPCGADLLRGGVGGSSCCEKLLEGLLPPVCHRCHFAFHFLQPPQRSLGPGLGRRFQRPSLRELRTDLRQRHLLGADQGDPEAMYCYGQRLKKGQGVKADVEQAIKYFKDAAEKGHANSMNWLGHIYEKGDGVPADVAEAVRWNTQSAEAGDSWAQTKMGMRCLKADGVDADDEAARKWLGMAAKQGAKAAISKLAELDAGDLD